MGGGANRSQASSDAVLLSVKTMSGGELHRCEQSFVAVSVMIVPVPCHESVVLCMLEYNSNSSLIRSPNASLMLKSTLSERGCSTRRGSAPRIMPAVLSCETVAQPFVSKRSARNRLVDAFSFFQKMHVEGVELADFFSSVWPVSSV